MHCCTLSSDMRHLAVHDKIARIKKYSLMNYPKSYRVGHLAEGTYNLTSLGPPQEEEPLQQIHEVEDLDNIEVHEVLDKDGSITEMQTSEPAAVERSGQRDSLS